MSGGIGGGSRWASRVSRVPGCIASARMRHAGMLRAREPLGTACTAPILTFLLSMLVALVYVLCILWCRFQRCAGCVFASTFSMHQAAATAEPLVRFPRSRSLVFLYSN